MQRNSISYFVQYCKDAFEETLLVLSLFCIKRKTRI